VGSVAASILSADLARLADQVKLVEPHAEAIHIDVMDAHFVPPLTIGPVVVASLRPVTSLTLHCHLMVERPAGLFDDLAAAGADMVSVHVEAVDEPSEVLGAARERGLRAGIALNPETHVDAVLPYLDEVENVVVMSVTPGWAGQPFRPEILPKVEALRAEIDRRRLGVSLEVDGGINLETGRRCIDAGATVLAAASSIYAAEDPAAAVRELAGVAARGEDMRLAGAVDERLGNSTTPEVV
jgi:ribulose-phosphate 3-epimerase